MTRVYCGNLPLDIKEKELEDLFRKYGRIRDISIKSGSRPPAFAFLSFEDHRDARDAIRGRDGYEFDGARLRVELANERARSRAGGAGGGGGGGGGGRRTEYRVIITGLSSSVSWQDLKDLGRSVGDVVHADVSRSSGEGVLEFSSKHDMFRATKKLDNTDFRGGPIRVRLPSDSRFRSSSRSRSPRARSRSRSRSRSVRRSSRSPPKRSRSPSPRDRSPDKKRSQSPDQREHSAERNGKREDGGRSRDDEEEQNGGGVKHERDMEEDRSGMDVDTN